MYQEHTPYHTSGNSVFPCLVAVTGSLCLDLPWFVFLRRTKNVATAGVVARSGSCEVDVGPRGLCRTCKCLDLRGQ